MYSKVVLCVGVFDLCHLGHIKFFEQAKAQGTYLVVALVEDSAVKSKKGEDRPIMNWHERHTFLSAIKYINKIVYLKSFNPAEALRNINPDIFFKGSDQTHIDETYAREHKIPIVYFERQKDGYSTTQLIARIRGESNG